MSENKEKIENANFKSDTDKTTKGTEKLINSNPSILDKINSIEIATDYLKQNTISNNSFSEQIPNNNSNNNKNDNNIPENKNLITYQNQIPNQKAYTGLENNSPYNSYYATPNNIQNQKMNQNYNDQNQNWAKANPGYSQNYQNNAASNQLQNYPQRVYNLQSINYAYDKTSGIPQQNQVLTSNYYANANSNNLKGNEENPNVLNLAQNPVYYQTSKANQANQTHEQNNIPLQMQMQNQNQYPIYVQTPISNQIPSAYGNPNLIPNQTQTNYLNNNQNNQNSFEIPNKLENKNPIIIQNPNLPNSPATQSQFYCNQTPVIPNYQIPIVPQINPIPVRVPSEPQTHGYINPYFKLLYNCGMSFVSGLIAKLLTMNIHVLESKNSFENSHFPESYRKLMRNFGSSKALAAIFPFSFTLVLWNYMKKPIEFVFRLNEKKLNEKYLSGNIDASLYLDILSRNLSSSFLMGYLLSKPLNFFDSVILGISHMIDVKGKKIDEQVIRKNIKEGYYVKYYNKMHNYSLIVYTLKYGLFFAGFDTIKFFKRDYRSHNFFANFKLAFYVSIFSNIFVYPFEIARQKFAYELIYYNYKQLETSEPIKKESFFKEFKEIFKYTKSIFIDNSSKTIGYGMFNKCLPSFYTAFAVAFYENYKY